jgi:hypothetical protein
MKENRKVVLKGNKKAIIKYNLEKIFDKSLDFIGFAIGLAILIFFINSVKDLDGYFKDRDYLLQLLKNENVVLIKSNVCKDIKEEGNRFVVNAECNAKEILRKRIDDNIFGFLLSDKFKKDQLPEKISKLTPIKHKNRFKNLGDGLSNKKLEKALSIKIKTKETKILTIENENKPVGCLEGDCWNNFSKKKYPNGYYIGEFNNGARNGQGTFVWSDGEKYIGEWKNEKKTGQGQYLWANGDEYSGEWKNNNRTGFGTFIWKDGAKYSGDFLDGEQTGKGTMLYSDGGRYNGAFLKGNRQGKGTLIWPSGKYDGEFKQNKRDGEGIQIWVNGDKYFGEFHQNKMSGEGTWISGEDNSMMVGKFESSDLTDGFVILPDGFKLRAFKKDGKVVFNRVQTSNQNINLLAQQLKRNNDLQTSRMLLDISKSLMGSNKNTSTLNLNNLNNGGGWLSGSSSSGMYKTCSYSSGLGTRTKTVFASAPCPMAY